MESRIRDEHHRSTELAYVWKGGISTGEDKLNQLYCILIEQNRMDDMKKAMRDTEFRQKLYREFELE